MTDMRATERLLEVIATAVSDAAVAFDADDKDAGMKALADLAEAVTELRRRGDTLVRAADLRVVLEAMPEWQYDDSAFRDTPEINAILDRLENALGGRMR